jgi:transposase, IS5 family
MLKARAQESRVIDSDQCDCRSRGGQFVLHAKSLLGNPYDGHTLGAVIPAIEETTGATLSRILADAGYKGYNAPPTHKFRVYISGQRRGMTKAIKKLMKRRAAAEPVIGHMKEDYRMGRNFLAHASGDAINARHGKRRQTNEGAPATTHIRRRRWLRQSG